MPKIKKLTTKYPELYKEYTEFIKRNNIDVNNVELTYFIYSNKFYNKNCFECKNKLTQVECSMYNLTIDDDEEWILVDNDYGTIYIKLTNGTIIGFRCANECLKPKNYRFLNQWIVDDNNILNSHYELLLEKNYFDNV
jgi:hypothetical protein